MKFKFIILTLFICSFTFAQNKGTITGILTDKDVNNLALPFANAVIKGRARLLTSLSVRTPVMVPLVCAKVNEQIKKVSMMNLNFIFQAMLNFDAKKRPTCKVDVIHGLPFGMLNITELLTY